MKKRNKIILVCIGILLALSVMISASYAFYMYNTSQSGTNAIIGECFKITLEDSNPISLSSTIPLTEEDAMKLEPYTFTIKNVCNAKMEFQANIETLNDSTMSLNAIRSKIDNLPSIILGETPDNNSDYIINDNAISSKSIYFNSLDPYQERTYNLRLFIDEESTMEESANKIFKSKLTVTTRLSNIDIAKLVDGPTFNTKIRKLVGTPTLGSLSDFEKYILSMLFVQYSLVDPMGAYKGFEDLYNDTEHVLKYEQFMMMQKQLYGDINILDDESHIRMLNLHTANMLKNLDLLNQDDKVKQILVADALPDSDVEVISVSTSDSKYDIKAWFDSDNGIVYLYSDGKKMFLNENASNMFNGFSKLEKIDMTLFDSRYTSNMSYMFDGLGSLSGLDLSLLNTSHVNNMNFMFEGSKVDFEDYSLLDTSSVETMIGIFDSATVSNTNFETLNISNVKDMTAAFSGLKHGNGTDSFSIDISGMDFSNVENMSYMFYKSTGINDIEMSGIDTSNVTNMAGLFSEMSNLNSVNTAALNTSKVTDMSRMFEGTSNLESIDVSNFDTLNVTNIKEMFAGLSKVSTLDLSVFENSNLKSISGLFKNMDSIKSLDLSPLNTSNVKSMAELFSEMDNLEEVDVSVLDTSSLENISKMFYNYNSPLEIKLSSFQDLSHVTNISGLFSGINNRETVDLTSLNGLKLKNTSALFSNSSFSHLDLTFLDTSDVVDMSSMFSKMSNITTLDLSHFDTSNVTSMDSMFQGMTSLTELNISNFNTGKVRSMYSMFSGVANLEHLNVSSFDTSNVTDMKSMFYNMKKLKELDLSNFNTRNVGYMDFMFSNMESLISLDVSNFDTSQVTDMNAMFQSCKLLTTLDVSSFNTSKVKNMSYMFSGASALESLDVSHFDTSKVTDMSCMFQSVSKVTVLDLSSFNTLNVEDMEGMFRNDNNLKTVYVGNDWSTSKVTSSSKMFTYDTKLVGGAGTTYDGKYVDKVYARVDGGTTSPGYLTLKTN